MKKCIFVCIFNQEKYIPMFYLLLESIFIYGNLDDNTNILIYTSTLFMNIIKQSHLFNDEKIKFEINNDYNDIDKSCKARLDLFHFSSISDYEKVLYLDTDILIKADVNVVFDVIKEDILYVVEEGTINDPLDYWGYSLFGDEINNYTDKSAFSSGILLFNNCDKIKNLFQNINNDIINRPYNFGCYDQPYIIYNAFKYNLYDNKILKQYGANALNDDYKDYNDKVIHHFPGGPGCYSHKIPKMTYYLNKIKDITICNIINKTKEYINMHLFPLIQICGEPLEGNIFTIHSTTNYNTNLNRAKNISNLVLNKNIKYVMEIGFNSGFSTLLMLMSNPNIKVTCYDIGTHKYMLPCYEKIKETFGERIDLIIGDSSQTLKELNHKYDLINIDGGFHSTVVESNIIDSYRLSKKGTIIIINDYNNKNINTLWNEYINIYNLKALDINLYSDSDHDVKYTIR